MEKLKPCPFCGGKPHLESDGTYYRFYHTCKGTDKQIDIFSSGYISKEKAIKAWNRRAKCE